MSRELILAMSISVDGFVAGPRGEIDWVFRNAGAASTAWLVERLERASLIAMGRASYEAMADYWPTAETPFAAPMNRIPKAVFSRSGRVATPALERSAGADAAVLAGWRNPTVAGTDLVADVRRLKTEEGGPIVALGGASFASALVAAGLVDVFRLAVHPVVLGRGAAIFGGLPAPLDLDLEETERFESGAVIGTYRPRK